MFPAQCGGPRGRRGANEQCCGRQERRQYRGLAGTLGRLLGGLLGLRNPRIGVVDPLLRILLADPGAGGQSRGEIVPITKIREASSRSWAVGGCWPLARMMLSSAIAIGSTFWETRVATPELALATPLAAVFAALKSEDVATMVIRSAPVAQTSRPCVASRTFRSSPLASKLGWRMRPAR